jgi:hypothetical protein
MHLNQRKFNILYLYLILVITGCVSTEPEKLRGCYSINDFYNPDTIGVVEGFSMQTQESSSWTGKYSFEEDSENRYVRFWFDKTTDSKIRSDRARVQLNMYSLADVKDFYLDSTFSLGDSLSNYMDEENRFEWLNIFELWVEPGWTGAKYPAKLHFSIVKNTGDTFFTPLLSAQYKDLNDKNWVDIWEKKLDLEVYPGEKYKFKFFLSVSPTQLIYSSISNLELENVASLQINDKITHPEYEGVDAVYWGVNPIKLYTGEKLLNKLEESNTKLSVTFDSFDFCAL